VNRSLRCGNKVKVTQVLLPAKSDVLRLDNSHFYEEKAGRGGTTAWATPGYVRDHLGLRLR
jgi:hypothetical protein